MITCRICRMYSLISDGQTFLVLTITRPRRFPSTWPVYSPAGKLANWLEYYAEALELSVWTSSSVTSASQDQNNKWHVSIKRGDGKERELVVNHLVFATGISGGSYRSFDYPGLVSESLLTLGCRLVTPTALSRISSRVHIFIHHNTSERWIMLVRRS